MNHEHPVPQNVTNIELRLRLANGNTARQEVKHGGQTLPPRRWRTGARWIGEGETRFGQM